MVRGLLISANYKKVEPVLALVSRFVQRAFPVQPLIMSAMRATRLTQSLRIRSSCRL